ncbi:MAG TPA: hypothetical protein VN258_14320 [Mobilitalea sp.]|nr:hypothetical protein [Mobilitalea sp.]
MKDKLSERLILLATAQECMTDIADMMEQWSGSQLNTEKNAFESMNVSDYVLNMSKEGKQLVEQLQQCSSDIGVGVASDEYRRLTALMDGIKKVFLNIAEASAEVNDKSHRIEGEVAYQKEMGDNIKNSLIVVRDSIDSAVACDEFMMADL